MIAVAMRVAMLVVVLALVVMVMGVLGGKYESRRNVLRSPKNEAKGHPVLLRLDSLIHSRKFLINLSSSKLRALVILIYSLLAEANSWSPPTNVFCNTSLIDLTGIKVMALRTAGDNSVRSRS